MILRRASDKPKTVLFQMGTADQMQRFGFGPDFTVFFSASFPRRREDFLART